jgi:hypothetical protein
MSLTHHIRTQNRPLLAFDGREDRLVPPLSSEQEKKKFVSTYGAYRPDRNGANHPYHDNTDDPDRDNNHPCRDVQNTRSGPIPRTIQSLTILIAYRSLDYLLFHLNISTYGQAVKDRRRDRF